jgi:hypothetical protein
MDAVKLVEDPLEVSRRDSVTFVEDLKLKASVGAPGTDLDL